jgi:hypothetical protein
MQGAATQREVEKDQAVVRILYDIIGRFTILVVLPALMQIAGQVRIHFVEELADEFSVIAGIVQPLNDQRIQIRLLIAVHGIQCHGFLSSIFVRQCFTVATILYLFRHFLSTVAIKGCEKLSASSARNTMYGDVLSLAYIFDCSFSQGETDYHSPPGGTAESG